MQHPDRHESWEGGHPDEGWLHEWLDEQLAPADAALMQSHVASCAVCQARVAEARGLMAASRRILSALDDVPAHVIPTNIATGVVTAATNDDVTLHNEATAVTPIDTARKTARAKTRVFPWQTFGKIAAVLVFAVAVAKSGFMMGDDVTVPVAAEKPQQAAAPAAAAASAPSATEAPPAERERPAKKRSADQAFATQSRPPAAAPATVPPPPRAMADASATADSALTTPSKTEVLALRAVPVTMSVPPASAARSVGAATASVADSVTTIADKIAPPSAMLSGKVAGVRVKSAPADAQRTARDAARDTTIKTRPSLEEMVRSQPMQLNQVVVTSAAGGNRRAAGAPSPSSSVFDSLTLNRTQCTPVCESSILHIDARGQARLIVGTGYPPRVAVATLSASQRDSLYALVLRTFPESALRVGRTSCEIHDRESLLLLLDFTPVLPPQIHYRCARSNEALRALGAKVDSITNTEALKLQLPPR